MSIGTNYNYKNNPAFGKNIPLKTFGEVSKPFVEEIKTGLNQFPRPILKQIKKTGLDDIRLAPKASDAYPGYTAFQTFLKTEFAPGSYNVWDEGMKAGFLEIKAEGNNKKLETIGFYESPKLAPKNNLANRGSVGHEFTHKTDDLLENAIGIKISQTESFKEAASKDLEKLPERLKLNPKLHTKWGQVNIDYTTQKSSPKNLVPYGLSEVFAECGAANTTGTSREVREKVKFMETFFPESYKYVQKYFYLLGKR